MTRAASPTKVQRPTTPWLGQTARNCARFVAQFMPGVLLGTRCLHGLLHSTGSPLRRAQVWIVPRIDRSRGAESRGRVQWEHMTVGEFLAWYRERQTAIFCVRLSMAYLLCSVWPDLFEVAANCSATPLCNFLGVGDWWCRHMTLRRLKAAQTPAWRVVSDEQVVATPVLQAVEKFCVNPSTFDGNVYALQALPLEGKTTAAIVVARREMNDRSPGGRHRSGPLDSRSMVVDTLHYYFNPFYAPTTTIVVRAQSTIFKALHTTFPINSQDTTVAQLGEAIGRDYVPHVLHRGSLAWLRPTPPRVTFIFDQADDSKPSERVAELIRFSNLCQQLPRQVRALALVKHAETLDELVYRGGGTIRQFMPVSRWAPESRSFT